VQWAVNRPMPAHSPVCFYEMLQMRIVMFFANSDQTQPDQNSGISWARSNVLPWIQVNRGPVRRLPCPTQPAATPRCTQREPHTEGKYEEACSS
jgi:hypothetical protein